MSMTDPVADMLTRIRNANTARHDELEIPASRLKEEIARILLNEGYIESYKRVDDQKQGLLKIRLKYSSDKQRVISGIKRVSRPGRRYYVGKAEMPRVLNGLGTAIISTSNGVMTATQARQDGVGGEVLCYIW